MDSELSPWWDEFVPDVLSSPITSRMYFKQEVIGEGGFGKCFKMMDLVDHETYAAKVLPLGHEPRDKIMHEIDVLSSLAHKHVVCFFQSFEDENYMYIFMELCSRKTLEHILDVRMTLTYPEVRYYTLQLISGLRYLHKKGILHRDIKLENLFIDYNMNLKLGDFGLAAKMEPEETRNKKICGTAFYIAPEVWDGRGHGPESDVWAVGIVIYTLLVGEVPFLGEDGHELSKMISELRYTLPPTISGAAQKLITGILKKDPYYRLTLDKIQCHQFFTKGFTPEKLPPISCFREPEIEPHTPIRRQFPHVAKNLNQPKRSKEDKSSCQQGYNEDSKVRSDLIWLKSSTTGKRNEINFTDLHSPLMTWALDRAWRCSSPCVRSGANIIFSARAEDGLKKSGVGYPAGP